MRENNCNVLSGVDTANVTGSKVDASQLFSASFQAVFADASAVGVFKAQFSNDICTFGNIVADFTPTNWSDIPTVAGQIVSVPVTAGGVVALLLTVLSYRWIRVVFIYTSGGSSVVNANMDAKGF